MGELPSAAGKAVRNPDGAREEELMNVMQERDTTTIRQTVTFNALPQEGLALRRWPPGNRCVPDMLTPHWKILSHEPSRTGTARAADSRYFRQPCVGALASLARQRGQLVNRRKHFALG